MSSTIVLTTVGDVITNAGTRHPFHCAFGSIARARMLQALWNKRMAICLNILSVLFAFAAAASWFYSAKVRVKPVEDERDEHGMKPATINVDGADIFKSLRAQSKWSAIAALFAGGAAVAQGIVLLF